MSIDPPDRWAAYEEAKAEMIRAQPSLQFLFDRAGGLMEYLWNRAYEQGRKELS